MVEKTLEELGVGVWSHNLVLVKGVDEALDGAITVVVPDHQLGDHGVVVDTHFVALHDTGFNAHVLPAPRFRGAQVDELAGVRKEVAAKEISGFIPKSWSQKEEKKVSLQGSLGIDTGLEGVAVNLDLVLGEWKGVARGHTDLPLHEISLGNHFRHGVLHLEAGVHLHEVEGAIRVHDELHRS